MSRTEKLYQKLGELEAEYKKRIITEFENVANKISSSMYLSRKQPYYFDSRSYSTKEVSEIERLEKDIIKLREKLNEPVPGEFIALVYEYSEKYKMATLNVRWSGGKEHYAKEILNKLNKVI